MSAELLSIFKAFLYWMIASLNWPPALYLSPLSRNAAFCLAGSALQPAIAKRRQATMIRIADIFGLCGIIDSPLTELLRIFTTAQISELERGIIAANSPLAR